MSTTKQSTATAATSSGGASNQADDSYEINWQDVKDLGLEPAPAGLTEDGDTQQG